MWKEKKKEWRKNQAAGYWGKKERENFTYFVCLIKRREKKINN